MADLPIKSKIDRVLTQSSKIEIDIGTLTPLLVWVRETEKHLRKEWESSYHGFCSEECEITSSLDDLNIAISEILSHI